MDSLQRDLAAAVAGEVDFTSRRRAEYSSDGSNYRLTPRGVVFPHDADDVAAALAVCRKHEVGVTTRGGGTSIAGNAVSSGVVIEMSRHMTRVSDVDPDAKTARVEAGVVPAHLNASLAEHGLRFGPDPSTHARCTIGGMIGNDACGSHSVAWGRTSDNIVELDVLCYDGTRMTLSTLADGAGDRTDDLHALVDRHRVVLRTELGRFSRQVSGYGLHHLLAENGGNLARALVGTEGTCVLVLAATVRLVDLPRHQRMIVAGFDDSVAAADAVPAILKHQPLTCEGMDDRILDVLRARRPDAVPEDALPAGSAWLLIDVDADEASAAVLANELAAVDGVRGVRTVDDPARRAAILKIREDGSGLATRSVDGTMSWPGWEDAAVPPANLGSYLRGFHQLLDTYGLTGVVYGHFGEGCLHVRLDFDFDSEAGVQRFGRFMRDAAELVVEHGGALSGEHGDGRARSQFLPTMYSDQAMRAFAEFKAIWDPDGRMNSGVLVDPAPATSDLRHDPGRTWLDLPTSLALHDDRGGIGTAVHRCIGIGKCRTMSGGVMCPSYRATRDEKDSTRGRARVLQEMLLGETITDGWQSDEVGEALDLCLSCKGCQSDCPIGVDMATYKSEYLYQRYRWRLRPASHYSMGWLPLLSRIAARTPRLVNRVTSSWAGRVLKRAGGVADERALPQFAERTFLDQFAGRTPAAAEGSVVLWPDTFTNFFDPHIGMAAADVLHAAGWAVSVPDKPRCCGLTWLSTGQLPMARRQLRRTLDTLAPMVDAGSQVVVLEPSCAALLRSDATELLPDDPRAAVVAQHTLTFAEFLRRQGWQPPAVDDRVAVQVHCHQHAVMGAGADQSVLRATGASTRMLDAGCCGLAGNFGFERGHYDTSVKVAEHGPLKALASEQDATVVADGFSCRTQFAQLAGRPSRHLAEVLRDAL